MLKNAKITIHEVNLTVHEVIFTVHGKTEEGRGFSLYLDRET